MSRQHSTAPPLLIPGLWEIDQGHSSIAFVARHLCSRIRGRFSKFGGTIEVGRDPTQSRVVVTVETQSIDTNHEERDECLRSPDFFDAERFPALEFRSLGVRLFDGERTLCMDGELTVRDLTRPVSFDVEYLGCSDGPEGRARASFSARTGIDRDDFGVNGNLVLGTGGVMAGWRVVLEITIEALLRSGTWSSTT